MQQLHNSSLSLIAGGISAPQRVSTTVLASVAQVSRLSRGATPNSNAHGDAAPYCNQYLQQPVTPKNGDRNALGQQYSWGTWWDDTH